MVPTQELIEEEVLECLRKILKDVSIIPHKVGEFTAANPPPTVSILLSQKVIHLLSFLLTLCLCEFE
jgi:hypothetical protein